MTKLSDIIALQSADLPIADAGSQFTTDNIEAALSSLSTDITALQGVGTGSQTLGTLSQTMNDTDEAFINLSEAQDYPIIAATKEVIGTNLASNDWSVDANDPKWDLQNSAPSVVLTPGGTTGSGVDFTLGAGNWSATDIGKTIINNTGAGRAVITTGPQDFNTITYTGNGLSQDITTGMSNSLVWIKDRDNTYSHTLFDIVTGSDTWVNSDTTGRGATVAGTLSFNSSGFTAGTSITNGDTVNYVAWCWAAGDGPVVADNNTDGTITSTTSANVAKGFSIVSYTGTSTNQTVGHGLSSIPEMIMFKSRDEIRQWPVYHKDVGASDTLYLDLDSAATTKTSYWNATAPDATNFSVGNGADTNNAGMKYIAYCWHSVAGHSKIGSWAGDSTNDGSHIITCGFKPAMLLVKGSITGDDWLLMRTDDIYNPFVKANGSGPETDGGLYEATATGFKILSSGSAFNQTGHTYIYMAFAENVDLSGTKAFADVTEDFPDTLDISSGSWELGCGNFLNDGKFRTCSEDSCVTITNSAGQINTTDFTDMNSMDITDAPLGGDVNYAFSTDDKTTWQIVGGDHILTSVYGGTGDDRFQAVTIDSQGNIICVGYGNSKPVIVKFDINFNVLASKVYDGAGLFTGITVDSQGDIVCVGYTTSEGGGAQDWLIMKFDNDFNILAQTLLGDNLSGNWTDVPNGVTVDGNDDIICCGYTTTEITSLATATVAKFSSDLTTVMAKKYYGGIGTDKFYSVITDSTNAIICCGSTDSEGVVGTDAFIVKFSSDLSTILARKCYGGTGTADHFGAVIVDSTNNIYCAGCTDSEGEGERDALIVKFDTSLNIIDSKIYGGIGTESFSSIMFDSNNNIICGGYTNTDVIGTSDALMVKLDSNFNVIASKAYGGLLSTYVFAGVCNSDDDIIFAGRTDGEGSGGRDGLIIKFPNEIPTGTFVGTTLSDLTMQDISNFTIANSSAHTLSDSSLTFGDSGLIQRSSIISMVDLPLTQEVEFISVSPVSRNIARDNVGTWEVNTSTTIASETWTVAGTNNQFDALKEAMDVLPNRMDGFEVNHIADAEWPVLGNTLDFAMSIDSTNSSGDPSISDISFNYDGLVGYDYLTLGTDYTVRQLTNTQLKVTANTSGNIHVKVRG